MSSPIPVVSRRVRRWHSQPGWSRPLFIALVLGFTLVVAACGPASPAGPSATRTPQPTATTLPSPTSVPSTAWRIVPSPNAKKYPFNSFSAVSALSPSAAWAVGGNFTDGGPVASLIEQWDGSAWHIVASPGTYFLNGVAAISPTDVWAVGSQPRVEGTNYRVVTLIEHWNGAQWSIVPSINPSSTRNVLNSVVALSASDVWAVGDAEISGASLPLVEHWNGVTWQMVATPALSGVTESTLSSVAKIAGTQQLWAVGYVLKGPRPAYEQPLIERWDGTTWQVISAPVLPAGSFGGKLNGVTTLSLTNAWAVGSYVASNHTIRTLVARWDGTSWQIAASPDTWGSLTGVSAANPNDVRVVGQFASGDRNNQHLLIEQWDGVSWHVITEPEPSGASYSSLGSITTDGAGGFWAVGSYSGGSSESQVLVEHCT